MNPRNAKDLIRVFWICQRPINAQNISRVLHVSRSSFHQFHVGEGPRPRVAPPSVRGVAVTGTVPAPAVVLDIAER